MMQTSKTTVVLAGLVLGLSACTTAVGPSLTAPTTPPTTDPVIVAAGDIACAPGQVRTTTTCHQGDTAALLAGADKVLTLGDQQYEKATLAEYQAVYDPTWGWRKADTAPVPGNHEYTTPAAQGYFDYFGAAAGNPGEGYYSFDVGTWHIVALNTGSPGVVPVKEGSLQNNWLEADLAAHPADCILAFWHHPRWPAGQYGSTRGAAAYKDLAAAHADVVLTGHAHNYQRWAPMNRTGVPSATGIRQFVVGTGGKSQHAPNATSPVGLEEAQGHTFGVLTMSLRAGSYTWTFLPDTPGGYTDTGTGECV